MIASITLASALVIGAEANLLFGYTEYRLYDDCLVAYDRLLNTPQWRVELRRVTETEASAAVLDRLPGVDLGQLFVRTSDDTEKLVGLTDAEAVRTRIDELRFD